jgi:hypothetical protein
MRGGVLELQALLELAVVIGGMYRDFDSADEASVEKEPIHAFRRRPSNASEVVA